ncbi:unnamed protein product, partial [Gulo gulo]
PRLNNWVSVNCLSKICFLYYRRKAEFSSELPTKLSLHQTCLEGGSVRLGQQVTITKDSGSFCPSALPSSACGLLSQGQRLVLEH